MLSLTLALKEWLFVALPEIYIWREFHLWTCGSVFEAIFKSSKEESDLFCLVAVDNLAPFVRAVLYNAFSSRPKLISHS